MTAAGRDPLTPSRETGEGRNLAVTLAAAIVSLIGALGGLLTAGFGDREPGVQVAIILVCGLIVVAALFAGAIAYGAFVHGRSSVKASAAAANEEKFQARSELLNERAKHDETRRRLAESENALSRLVHEVREARELPSPKPSPSAR